MDYQQATGSSTYCSYPGHEKGRAGMDSCFSRQTYNQETPQKYEWVKEKELQNIGWQW